MATGAHCQNVATTSALDVTGPMPPAGTPQLSGLSTDSERIGPAIVARLSAGVPVDHAAIDCLEGRWRALAEELERAQPESRRGVRTRYLDSWADGRVMLAAILQANPNEDPFKQPDSEPPLRTRHALKSAAVIEAMPPPEYLVGRHIVSGAFALLYGQPGSMKSFAALDLACSVAAGVQWFGLEQAKRGTVVYVAAEGGGGLGKRIAAWRAEHPGADLSRLHFDTDAVNLMDSADVAIHLEMLRSLPEPPVVVIYDTLARCMIGADENSSRDMGIAIAAMDRVRQEFRSAVIPVHHTGKNGEQERGSSALGGAADTVMKMTGDGTTTTLACVKQKDDEEFSPIVLRLRPIEGTGSCVLEFSDRRLTAELRPKARELLAILDSHFTDEGAGTTAWKEASGMSPNTFFASRRDLIKLGYVAHDGKRGGRHTLTSAGRAELGIEPENYRTTVVLPSNYHGSDPDTVQLLPTTTAARKGGSGSSSNGRVPGESGRASILTVNAVLDAVAPLPWSESDNYHTVDFEGRRRTTCSTCHKTQAMCPEHSDTATVGETRP